MKNRKREARKTVAAPSAPRSGGWPWILALVGAVVVVFWAYSPALHGEFLFDDNFLPFALPNAATPLRAWIGQIRPVLMTTYWFNWRISGDDPYSFHVLNVVFHCITGILVFLIVRRLLEWSGTQESRRDLLAGFTALVFLLHPAQTESVAYLAGRSESLSALLSAAAFTVFLYRRRAAASWTTVAAIFVLFGAAVLSKEQAVVLPALLLLTDYWWNPGFSFKGIRGNWRLYAPMAAGGAAGVAFFWSLILGAGTSGTAGFGMKDFTWYQYFFTQCRALFVYIGIFLLPVNLTADWDFPISRTILDRGAIFGLLALLALAAAAWRYRRRFPLASYGYFVFLILMSPTSSILPIKDPIAERRLYLPMLGLLLIVVDFARRLKLDRKVLAAGCLVVALLAAGATRARAHVWTDQVSLWEDTVHKSPNKARAHVLLGFAYQLGQQYDLAIGEYERAARLQPPTQDLLVNWALACDALNQPDRALAKLSDAVVLPPPPNVSPANVYAQIARVHAQQSRWPEALQALATAEKLDPGFPDTYVYRGKIYLNTNQAPAAIQEYLRALAIDPTLEDARHDLAIAEARLRAGH
jgi:tetratricopeptide (TPR) repeat protein